MRKVATFLVLGLALVSALAWMQWSNAGNLKDKRLEATKTHELVKQENAKLKMELEKEQKKSADLEEDASEVHRLRGEVARLTRIATEIDRVKSELSRLEQENQSLRRNRDAESSRPELASGAGDVEDSQIPGLFPKDEWIFRGSKTPEDTLVSFFSTLIEGNVANSLKLMSPRMLEKMPELMREMSDQKLEQFAAKFNGSMEHWTGIHVLGSTQISDDIINVSIQPKGIGLEQLEWRPAYDNLDLTNVKVMVPVQMRQIDGNWLLDDPNGPLSMLIGFGILGGDFW